MAEEKKDTPLLAFKNIAPVTGELKLKLDCAKPVKSGTNKWGVWNLWFGFVENFEVQKGRKPNVETIENYSGKVMFFPTEKMNEQLMTFANGKINAEVLVKHNVKQVAGKFRSEYLVEKLSDGTSVSEDTLTPYEGRLITDAKSYINEGRTMDEPTFIKVSKQEMYGGQISEERAKDLYTILSNDK